MAEEMVYVEYIESKSKANKVGFVAKYRKSIADILVKRGQVKIITSGDEKARAQAVITQTREAAVNKPKASIDGTLPPVVGTREEL